MTGIKTSEIRKPKRTASMQAQQRRNNRLSNKSKQRNSFSQHAVSELFKLDGLVGRDSEIAQLRSCLDRMMMTTNTAERQEEVNKKESSPPSSSSQFLGNHHIANKEIVLISGPGGMGKSVIARSLQNDIVTQGTGVPLPMASTI